MPQNSPKKLNQNDPWPSVGWWHGRGWDEDREEWSASLCAEPAHSLLPPSGFQKGSWQVSLKHCTSPHFQLQPETEPNGTRKKYDSLLDHPTMTSTSQQVLSLGHGPANHFLWLKEALHVKVKLPTAAARL